MPASKTETMDTLTSDIITVPGNTILELVEYWGSTSNNETPAFVSVDASYNKRTLNRKEVLELSKRFAYRLHSLGIKKGDIICNTLPNSLERVVSEFGIQFSGAASMNGQILRSDGEDFFQSLKVAQCVAVIVDPNVPKSVYQMMMKIIPAGCENYIQSEKLPNLKQIILCIRDNQDCQNDFISSLQKSELPQFRADVSPTDLATVMTTSGSTGYSKLVKHTHSNICHFGKQVKAIESFPDGAHFVNCAPLGWAGGFPQWYLSCGVTRHFIDMHAGLPPDIPGLLWRVMVQEKIVYGFLTPMFVNAILTKSPWQTAEWKPKILCLAGQPVKKEALRIIGKLCDKVDINYGMTECNVLATHRIVDPSTYADGCAGYPGYGVKIRIVDINRQDVPQGNMGEVLVSSPSLCAGYLSNELMGSSAFTPDGWFCTDDAGYIGSDGKLYIEGRQSDCIMRGVYILYPGWLEKQMKEFPGVQDIVIVGVPDKVLHNEICACIVVNDIKGVVPGRLHNIDTKIGSYLDEPYGEDDVKHQDRNSKPFSFEKDCDKHKRNHIQSCDPSKSSYNTEPQSKQIFEKEKLNSDHQKETSGSSICENVSNIQQSVSSNNDEKGTIKAELNLSLFEKDIRHFANGVNNLDENDAMRMIPKYYVFMESFPTTSTGKIKRKEIRNFAASVLGLA